MFPVRCLPLWLCAVGASVLFAAPASAAVINTFDSPGDVVLSPTQAPGTWYTDRYAPAGFAAGQTGGGRTGVLQHSISSADANGLRPAGFNTPFYNTQGRKFDLAAGTTGLGAELFVSQSWAGLNQSQSGSGRLASLWASANGAGKFPIIEFDNANGGQFRVWDDDLGGWQVVGGFNGYDQWYDLGFELNGGAFNYFVNGGLVYSDSTTGSATAFSNVILQGYNSGNSYDIYWDNLSNAPAVAPVPEPATLAVFGSLGLIAFGYRARRKARA